MKHIGEIAKVSCLESAREEKKEQSQLNPKCSQLVDLIFIKFALLCREYDALYADTRRENAEKLQWTLAFTKLGITTKNQIQFALDKTGLHKWGKPPQLGQFLEWITPSPNDVGFPDVHKAFAIAGRINVLYGDYIHPHVATDTVIKHVIDQIGATKFRSMDEKSALKLFETYYAVSCRQYIQGELKDILRTLPQTPEPHPIDKKKSDEARRKCMEELRSKGFAIKRAVQEDSF